jgi:hypothetical protein
MNEAAEIKAIFSLFFAIFWGISANAHPRWKAFNWSYFHLKRVRRRLRRAIIIFNIIPIFYFSIVYWLLGKTDFSSSDNWLKIFDLILFGVFPAFSPFGFYRLWIGCMELSPDYFYKRAKGKINMNAPRNKVYFTEAPKVEIFINKETACKNILVGLIYIIISVSALLPTIIKLTYKHLWHQ